MQYENVGRRMSKRRREMGISVPDMAKILDISRATIYRYENGNIQNIKMPVIESIANVLKVSPLWLLGKTEIMEDAETKRNSKYYDVRTILTETMIFIENREGFQYNDMPLNDADKQVIITMLKSLVDLMDTRYI